MRKSVLLILLLAFAMQGCKKIDPMTDLDSVIVSAEDFIAEAEDFGPQTKTSLTSSRKVVWSEDDQIAIFQGSSLADRFQVSDESVGNSNGVFSFVGNSGEENGDYSAGTETTLETNVALYPYQDGIECSAITDEEDVVTSYTITGVTIPANQIYAEDSFAEESFIMAAVTEGVVDHNLKFKNVCGAIKLQLKGERTIKSISVAGKGDEVIAGEGVVTVYPNGTAPKVVMDESGEKVITLDCSEDGGVALSQEEATVFVIAVPPTPFENGFTVTITDVDDNAEIFSASAGTSVERSVITVMPEIDVLTSAYLPDGPTFNNTVDDFMTGKGITGIKFITNSATTSENALVDGSIYLVQNGQTLEIHTAANQFVANNNCNSMFYAYKGYDNSTSQAILNSFGQILVIDFGDNFNTQNVTYMNEMFRFCTSLTSLDVSKFDTQNVTNMNGMFYKCSSLTSLDVSNFETQNVTDMYDMFYNCRSLTSLDVSNFETQNVTDMGWMFDKCSSLTSLDLSNFNTQNVTDMEYMFSNCSSLTSLDVSNFNTQNVTDMYSMFSGCSNLTSLDVSNFDTQNVTEMVQMFRNCSSLTSLDVSKFNTQNVTNMTGMFYECTSLTSLDLSNFTFESNPNIGAIFSSTGSNATNKPIPIYVSEEGKSYIETKGNSHISSSCAILTDKETFKEIAYLPDGRTFNSTVDDFMTGKGITEIKFITNSATTSEDALVDGSIYLVQNGQTLEIHTAASQFVANSSCSDMFAGDYYDYNLSKWVDRTLKHIKTIDFGENFNTQNVIGMSGMFRNCSSLTSLDVSNFDTQNVISMNQMFSFCSSLTSLDVSKFDTQNVTDMEWMFRNCSSLTSLDVSNFNTQNVTDMFGMFERCSSLTSLDVSNFDTQKVTNMSQMFEECSSLTSLDVSNFDTQNVTKMRYMFYDCSSLTSLDVSNFVTQNVTDMSGMFHDCSSLTSLDLSNFDTQNVTYMYSMFYYCSSLTSLDVSKFNTQNVTDMYRMFSGCSSLTSLDVSNFDTQNVTDMDYMFSYCRSLTSLDVSNFDTHNVTNMREMFYYCSSLTSLDLSNFNTQNVTTMVQMFYDCSSLSSLDLSKFTFESNPDVYSMFSSTGSNATNKPIPIYVSAEGKDYIETKGNSYISSNYATLTIKAPQTE